MNVSHYLNLNLKYIVIILCIFVDKSIKISRITNTLSVKFNHNCIYIYITKLVEKKLVDNYARMLRAVLNTSWRQYPTKQQLFGHLPPMKTIQVRRTRHAGHCWRSKDELIGDVLLWTPSHGRAKIGRPVRTYIQQLCADTGYSSEDLSGTMDDRDGWRERVKEIRAKNAT